LPVGGNDVLNALYRRMSRPTPNISNGYSASSGIPDNAFDGNINTKCTQSAPDGYIAVNYGLYNPVYVGSIGVLPGVSGTFHAIFECSDDGASWNTLYDPGITAWADNQWLWYDIDPGQTAQYYRMRETGGNTLVVRELYFGNNSTEIPMARLNRDDYTSLPNKKFYCKPAVPVLV
jgi:hypothetical protein